MSVRVLHPREVAQLLGAVNLRSPFGPRDHWLLTLALHTGLRVSELVGLDVAHVAWQGQPRKTLELPAALGKGGRGRIIPLNQTARQAVAEILAFNQARGFSVAPEAPLLVNRFHQRASTRYVQRLVEGLRESAGLDVHENSWTSRRLIRYRPVNRLPRARRLGPAIRQGTPSGSRANVSWWQSGQRLQ